ncbi:hypothetical protein XELAEV_18008433mg [Xenopus laevis]|uniref:Uncharacterized protein n=1 Tax=Xenopus laevis TaxID=8355 RepID=A0A974E4M5_XENLA|nr:hypothetical protein XELAEV_18008433mg [Xenopus laevis]
MYLIELFSRNPNLFIHQPNLLLLAALSKRHPPVKDQPQLLVISNWNTCGTLQKDIIIQRVVATPICDR